MAAAGVHVFRPGIDANFQRFFDVHLAEIGSDNDSIEFEGFGPDDVYGQPVNLVNSDRDRDVATDIYVCWCK